MTDLSSATTRELLTETCKRLEKLLQTAELRSERRAIIVDALLTLKRV